ncbi:MAG: hypothetical protein KJ954_14430 [Alphaproteobacteria bacterium]|nr:hypothetical protein [Alphaproteobacteria bacterium]
MKKNWIQKATKKMEQKGTTGAFSAKAKKAGMSTAAYASKVLKKGSTASPSTKKQANFARNVKRKK